MGETTSAVLAASGIVKTFGPVQALNGVEFSVRAGEIHALVGDNGAGKSTLIKVFSGVHQPDRGTLCVDGKEVLLKSPSDAHDVGIETVYQDLALALTLDAGENVFLGREILRRGFLGRLGFVDREGMRRQVAAELERLGTSVPSLRSAVERMSGGQRQAIAVARAALWGRRVLIMDEPSAALAPRQAANVLRLMDRVRAESGLGVIFISHSIPHVLEIADRVSVMRRGRVVLTAAIGEVTTEGLVRAMTDADELEEV